MVFIHIVEDVISQVIFLQFCSGKGACGTRSSSCTCSSCRHCGCGGANSEDTNWTGIFALPKEQPRPLICPWELQILERGPKKSDWLHMEWSVNTVYLQRKSQVAPILASIWLSFYVLLPLSLIIISNWVLKMAIVTVRNMHLPIMFTCRFPCTFEHALVVQNGSTQNGSQNLVDLFKHIMCCALQLFIFHRDPPLVSNLLLRQWRFVQMTMSCWKSEDQYKRVWVALIIWSPNSQMRYHVLIKIRILRTSYRSQYEVTRILLSYLVCRNYCILSSLA